MSLKLVGIENREPRGGGGASTNLAFDPANNNPHLHRI
jgi:hypothetical protein